MNAPSSINLTSVNMAEMVENGRPRAASVEQSRRNVRLRTLEELWLNYSFQIVVVTISFVLLIYSIAGKVSCKNPTDTLGGLSFTGCEIINVHKTKEQS